MINLKATTKDFVVNILVSYLGNTSPFRAPAGWGLYIRLIIFGGSDSFDLFSALVYFFSLLVPRSIKIAGIRSSTLIQGCILKLKFIFFPKVIYYNGWQRAAGEIFKPFFVIL